MSPIQWGSTSAQKSEAHYLVGFYLPAARQGSAAYLAAFATLLTAVVASDARDDVYRAALARCHAPN